MVETRVPAGTGVASGPGDGGGTLASLVVLIGGALAVISSFLTWATVTGGGGGLASSSLGPLLRGILARRGGGRLRGLLGKLGQRAAASAGSRSITGVHTGDGRIVLALGVALVVVAALAMATRWGVLRAAAGGIGAAIGAVVCVVGIAAIAEAGDTAGGPLLQRLITVSTGFGVYLALIGGAVALIGGIVAFLVPPPAETVLAAAPVASRAPVAPVAPTEPAPPTEPIPRADLG